MKTCHKCKKELQEDMFFCPYCGEKQEKDVKSELNEAMAELFMDTPQETSLTNIQAEKSTQDKTNQNISRILTIVIGSIIVLMVSSILAMGVSYFSHKKDNSQGELPPVVEKDNPVAPKEDENKGKTDEPVEKDDDDSKHEGSDPEGLDFTAQCSEGVTVSKLTAVKEKGKIKLTVIYQAPGSVEVSLTDDAGKVQAGPFEIEKGNRFYFLLNQVNKESYTIKIVDQKTKAESTVTVTGQEIRDELD